MPAVLNRPTARPTLLPQPGESQPAFAVRYHRAMRAAIPDTDRRNAACFRAWDTARGGRTDADRIAREKFPADRFRRVAAVPYFAEHQVDGEHGTETYDAARLAEIVRLNNDRSEDVGAFAPIALGHTPTAEAAERGAAEPPVLGYAANYRLGMIGRKNPRWCVFADEYHHAEDAGRLARMPRRSVEIWKDGTIDPVAALGATTPRLDVGMARFFRDPRTGVVKYSMPAFAGGDNTFAPGPVGGSNPKRRRYAAEKPMPALDQAAAQALVSDLADAMLGALSKAGVIQGDDASPEDAPPADDLDDPDDELPPEEERIEGGPHDDPPVDEQYDDERPADEHDETADMDDDERKKYTTMSGEGRRCYMLGRNSSLSRAKKSPFRPHQRLSRAASPERGESDAARYARLAKGDKEKAALLADNDRLRTQASRYARNADESECLSIVQSIESSGVVIPDVKAEAAHLQSLPKGKVRDGHIARMKTNYQRVPSSGFMPTPDLPELRNARDRQDYSRKRSDRAMAIVTEARAAGRHVEFEAAVVQADKELGGE